MVEKLELLICGCKHPFLILDFIDTDRLIVIIGQRFFLTRNFIQVAIQIKCRNQFFVFGLAGFFQKSIIVLEKLLILVLFQALQLLIWFQGLDNRFLIRQRHPDEGVSAILVLNAENSRFSRFRPLRKAQAKKENSNHAE